MSRRETCAEKGSGAAASAGSARARSTCRPKSPLDYERGGEKRRLQWNEKTLPPFLFSLRPCSQPSFEKRSDVVSLSLLSLSLSLFSLSLSLLLYWPLSAPDSRIASIEIVERRAPPSFMRSSKARSEPPSCSRPTPPFFANFKRPFETSTHSSSPCPLSRRLLTSL